MLKPINIGPETGKEPNFGLSSWMTQGLPKLSKLESLDWVQEMMACPQDPIWHAEGDVWTHTKMVLEALLELPEYYDLSEEAQFVLAWAAILHDIGKPLTTVIESDGRIGSPRHAKLGEKMARQLLWNLDLGLREQICALVRLHGQPIWWTSREFPHRLVILNSQRVDNQLLYLFAKADMLGRISKESNDFFERIELYKELCIEADVWEKPFSFANGHSAFRFFLKEEEWPTTLFDDTEFEVLLLSGLPGAGKDTYAANFDLPMISLDEIRKELKIKFSDKNGQGKVAQLAYDRAKIYCAKKQSFIWNSTNLTADLRMRLLRSLSVYNPRFKLVYLETSYEETLEHRKDYIPGKSLEKMFRILDMPLPYEAHELCYIRR